MSKYFSKVFLATLTVLTLSSFALVPVAEARGDRGGGGHHAGGAHGGGGAHAGGGRAGGGNRQVDNSHRDVRANNVRNTSVNNVNSNRNTNINNRNVNVNVDNNNGWDNDYHPVARAAAVTAAVVVTAAVIGSVVNSVPDNCYPVNYGGYIYQQCGDDWYQTDGTQYIVVNPPY